MDLNDSVTRWIGKLKAGDERAAHDLWQRYFEQLVALARSKLGTTPKRAADEEDVALSVFDSFCRGAARGKFPELLDRDSLWPLLVVITVRKSCDLVNHERRQKRGGGRVQPEADLAAEGEEAFRLDHLLGETPTPEFVGMMNEQCQCLLTALDADQQRIALGKFEGLSNKELAERLDCGLRTIERRLDLIRRIWEAHSHGQNDR